MIREVEIKTVKVSYFCDDCGGEVKSILPSELKPQEHYIGYPIRHVCENCYKQYYLKKPYPYIKYVELI